MVRRRALGTRFQRVAETTRACFARCAVMCCAVLDSQCADRGQKEFRLRSCVRGPCASRHACPCVRACMRCDANHSLFLISSTLSAALLPSSFSPLAALGSSARAARARRQQNRPRNQRPAAGRHARTQAGRHAPCPARGEARRGEARRPEDLMFCCTVGRLLPLSPARSRALSNVAGKRSSERAASDNPHSALFVCTTGRCPLARLLACWTLARPHSPACLPARSLARLPPRVPACSRACLLACVRARSRSQVSTAYGNALAEKWGCAFVETSAKYNINVDQVFRLALGTVRACVCIACACACVCERAFGYAISRSTIASFC